MKAEFDVSKAPADALKTASGLEYVIVAANASGRKVKDTDWVLVHYSGRSGMLTPS